MISLLVSLMLAGSPALAQDLKKPDLQVKVSPIDVRTQGLTFPSGLQIILQQDAGASIIQVGTVHSGGMLLDPEGKHGTSHLANHLVYSGRIEDASVRDALYAKGLDYGSDNSVDWVTFRTVGPPSALPTILKAEGLRITDPFHGVTDEDVMREKTIYSLEPYFVGANTILPAVPTIMRYAQSKDHRYGGLGMHLSQDELQGVTMDDLQDYADKVFIPSETTIAISGPIDFDKTISAIFANVPPKALHPDATDEHLKQFFKPDVVNPDPENPDHVTQWLADPETGELIDLTWKPTNRIDWEGQEVFPPNEDYERGDVIHIEGLVETPLAVVAWAVPGAWAGEDVNKTIAPNALANAGGWWSVFEIKKNAGGGAEASCTHAPTAAGGWIICWAMARDVKTNADELTDRLKAASAVFGDPNATWLHQQTVDNAKRGSIGGVIHALDSHTSELESIAVRTALATHFAGDPGYTTKWMNDMMAAEPGPMRKWILDWLPEARSVSIVVDPLPRDKWLALSTSASYHGSVFGHSIPETQAIPDNEEIAAATKRFDTSKIKTATLANGMKVVVYPHGTLPVASAAIAYRGGGAYEHGLDPYVTATMRNLFNEIYEDPTGRKQELLPERIGAAGVGLTAEDVTYEGWAVPSQNLGDDLYLMRRNDMARKVQLSNRPNWWKSVKQSLPVSWDIPTTWALHDRMARILPEHPLAWHMDQERAIELRDLAGSDLIAYQKRKYRPENATLVITGAVDPDAAIAEAKTYFDTWKVEAAPPLTHDVEAKPAQPGAVLLYAKDGADNTTIAASCRLPAPDAKLSAAQQVLGTVTNESMVRELGSADVGALASSATVRSGMGVAWMDFATVVPHGKASVAVDHLRDVIKAAADGQVEPDRLQLHKLRLAGAQAMGHANSKTTLDVLARDHLLPHRGPDFSNQFADALIELEPKDLAAAVDGCLDSLTVSIETPSSNFSGLQSDQGAEVVDWLARADAEFEKWDKGLYKKRMKQRAKGN